MSMRYMTIEDLLTLIAEMESDIAKLKNNRIASTEENNLLINKYVDLVDSEKESKNPIDSSLVLAMGIALLARQLASIQNVIVQNIESDHE